MTDQERAAANAPQIEPGDRRHPEYGNRGYHGKDWIDLYRRTARMTSTIASLQRAIAGAAGSIPPIAPQWQPDRYEDARQLLDDAEQTADLLLRTIAAAAHQAFRNTPTEWQREHAQHAATTYQKYYDAITAHAAPHD